MPTIMRIAALRAALLPEGLSSQAFAAYIKAEIAKWKKVITAAHSGTRSFATPRLTIE
jgi:tripartite-type tricarboxylate transporter receptor subunit TctC